MKHFLFIISFVFISLHAISQDYKLDKDISYISPTDADAYKKERCKLDIYYPTEKKSFQTVIWFHGGGLEGGEKSIPVELKEKGVAVVAVNYRLSPKAKCPAYIDDAAESIAWVFNNIASYGGDPNNVFVSGHSAGGYLTLMVGMDKSYLKKFGIEADRIKGLIPVSGQTNTHFTIKKERGLSYDIPYIDEYAPISFSSKDVPPVLLITGDKNLEMAARYEENAHLYSVLKHLGHQDATLYELEGFDHVAVYQPACYLIIDWMKKHAK